MPFLFELWAGRHQLPPRGEWLTWVCLGGRGAGKTRAGSEWVRWQVEGARPLDRGRCRRVALVGETYEQARDVMVFGESGILACSPPDRRPRWEAVRRRLVWPNGAEARVFSASDPEAMRGPQFDAAWCDELAKWRKGREAFDMLRFALRLGGDPRCVVTTTPRPVPVLKELLARPSTAVTRARTEANAAFLAPSFLREVRARYEGTRLGRQELDGELIETPDGALWPVELIEAARCPDAPELERVVVAVDPAATSKHGSDACGIVVCGVAEGIGYVLEDATVQRASPGVWARRVVEVARKWSADRVVAEANQGGEMIEALLRGEDRTVPYRSVHASRAKSSRAEPVAALYERGLVRHAAGLKALEAQMGLMTVRGFEGHGSPDRVDALVWALGELMLRRPGRPGVRTL
ncbi:phage terminase large subunit-like protein [Hasllibacter halocynthiae]|uniref:Phage terminase large subunit-like protein n=1 Tax=Hasllibacter halocynthiae TaxID=595589 RepID=A0A2T0X8U7_9RHOB|nr:terminase family protein [Hasllibacter halocynthiae]PRY95372.1 phage terminase large subunit-like protein [Hasllibacter halocynthiae]